MVRQPLPDLTDAVLMAALKKLSSEMGGRTTLAQASKALRERQPKRARLVYSTEVVNGEARLIVVNKGGVQLRPIVLRAEDNKGEQHFSIQLNAGFRVVHALDKLYGEVTVLRVNGKKTKKVAQAVASTRPQFLFALSWTLGGQILEVEIRNIGGDMRDSATLLVDQGDTSVLIQSVRVDGGGTTVAHINAEKLSSGPLTIKLLFDTQTLDVPAVPKPVLTLNTGEWLGDGSQVMYVLKNLSSIPMLAEVTARVTQNTDAVVLLEQPVKLAVSQEAGLVLSTSDINPALPIHVVVPGLLDDYVKLPEKPAQMPIASPEATSLLVLTDQWSFSAPRWTSAHTLEIDITNNGPDKPVRGYVYADTLPFTGIALDLTVNTTQTLVISGKAAESLVVTQSVRLWIDSKLVHTFLVPSIEAVPVEEAIPVTEALRAPGAPPNLFVGVSMVWDGDEVIVTLTKLPDVALDNVFIYLENATVPGEYLSLMNDGDSREYRLTGLAEGDSVVLWMDADPIDELIVPQKPTSSESPASAFVAPVSSDGSTQETAYM